MILRFLSRECVSSDVRPVRSNVRAALILIYLKMGREFLFRKGFFLIYNMNLNTLSSVPQLLRNIAMKIRYAEDFTNYPCMTSAPGPSSSCFETESRRAPERFSITPYVLLLESPQRSPSAQTRPYNTQSGPPQIYHSPPIDQLLHALIL